MAEWGFYPAGGFEARTSAGSRKPSKHVGRTTRMGIEQYQDYTLYINDQRAVSGFSDTKTTVPARDVRPVSFRTHVRYADVGAQLRGFMSQKTIPAVRLEGIGHFDTPIGTIDYPVKLFQGQ